jgi:hypothetical protein
MQALSVEQAHREPLSLAGTRSERTPPMSTMCNDQNFSAMAPSHAEHEELQQLRAGNFVYQAATVLAILLFLISF